jgi:hypothetical protein
MYSNTILYLFQGHMGGYSVTLIKRYCLVGILDYVHPYSGPHPMLRRANSQRELGPLLHVGYETNSPKTEAHKSQSDCNFDM